MDYKLELTTEEQATTATKVLRCVKTLKDGVDNQRKALKKEIDERFKDEVDKYSELEKVVQIALLESTDIWADSKGKSTKKGVVLANVETLVIEDEDNLPSIFYKVEMVPKKIINKAKIKEIIKAGGIVTGAKLVSKKSLRVDVLKNDNKELDLETAKQFIQSSKDLIGKIDV